MQWLYIILYIIVCSIYSSNSVGASESSSNLQHGGDNLPSMPAVNVEPFTSDGELRSIQELRKERKRLRKERRLEKQGRRQNRRLNKQLSPVESREDSEPSTFRVQNASPLPQESQYGTRLDQAWILRNLSSIWHTIHLLQNKMDSQITWNPKSKITHSRRKEKKVKVPEAPISCSGMEEMRFQACSRSNGTECAGNGRCVCGSCFCNPPFYGSSCQCDDDGCPSINGVKCGGTKQGQCRCGSCVCRPNFTGGNCECSTEVTACRNHLGDICSRNGDCRCNRCYCNQGYVGSLCEESIYSASVCEKLKPCVLCQAYDWFYPQCADCQTKIVKVDKVEMSRLSCVMVNLGCILKYSYEEDPEEDKSLVVYVPKDLKCPSPRNSEKKKLLNQP